MGRSYEFDERSSSCEASPTNAEIARKLKEIRTLMEFAGEPFFKFMAYERAAETLENAPPAAQLLARGAAEHCRGSARRSPAASRRCWTTGTIAYYDELAARYPADAAGSARRPGHRHEDRAGAVRRARDRVARRPRARARLGRARRALPRLGKKSLENIKRGILAYKGRRRARRSARAAAGARDRRATSKPARRPRTSPSPAACGAPRPTVGDIDIVCTSHEPGDVIARFVKWERAEAVLAEGVTKASIWLEGGLQIDLRVLPGDVYGNLLQHFTGSREHNIQLRELAVRKGLRVSENGVLDVATATT
jgi:DNA polymerase (family 10)